MSSRLSSLTAVALSTLVATAAASAQGGVELGGFGSYTKFDSSLALGERAGGGARLSLISGTGFSTFVLEAEGAYATRAIGPVIVRYVPARARLLYGLPLGSTASILLGGGGVRNDYNDGTASVVEWGYTALAGLRVRLGSYMTLRLDGVMDYIANPANESATLQKNINRSAQAGLSFPLWTDRRAVEKKEKREAAPAPQPIAAAPGAAPVAHALANGPDADRDGVADAQDACSNTPAGASVDTQGCMVYRDSDGDGMIDPRDACPATAAGAAIDGNGCPMVKDADNDGVADARDRCPATPAGERVDSTGCAIVFAKAETDTDNDGVIDSRDRCPATPVGSSTDTSGCPIVIPKAESDTDSDGVVDSRDRCPATPAGIAADASGCAIVIPKAETDTDGDGVMDSRDKCPATPAGASADASGCTILFKNSEKTVTLRGVTFAPWKDELTQASLHVLDDVARQLNDAPTLRIEVAGHTDNRGANTANIKLSLARAEAVRAYLVMQGVAAERLLARGYGPGRPVANNATPGGRALNRRVELRRLD